MTEVMERPFTWSYSRLKAFEDCPRRYHETTVLKNYPESTFDQSWGNAVHAAMAHALRTGTRLPTVFQLLQPWIDAVNESPGEMLIEDEARLAITREFTPTAWFAKKVWLRTIADVIKLDNDLALVVDWKAGKSANVDPIQLVLTSLMILIHFPKVECVRSDFVWLQEDDRTTQVLYREDAADQWALLLPRVKSLQEATEKFYFPPTPNRFCKSWCPVRTCEYHGK